MLTDKTWAETRDVLKKRYERVAKRSEQITADDVFENFMNAFAHVFDPHSSYFSPRNSEEYRIAMSLSYEGIGASLQSIDDYVTIMEILPGGSAQQNGELKANDRILAVGQGKDGKMVDVGRLAPRRRRAADPRPERLVRAPADPARQCAPGHAGTRARCCRAPRSRSKRRRPRRRSARSSAATRR